MSLILTSGSKRPSLKKGKDIEKRDMSKKQKIIRKVCELPEDGQVKVTASWTVDHSLRKYRIAFSRDNLHVWINGQAVETTSYITDKGYDVDLYFAVDQSHGHIYSDVEGHEMMNYLLLDGEIKGQNYMQEQLTK